MNKISIIIIILLTMIMINCGKNAANDKNVDKASSSTKIDNQKSTITKSDKIEINAKTAKSYFGGWPVNSNIPEMNDPGFNNPCPGSIGCECKTESDCDVGTCFKMPRGQWCSPDIGVQIPNFTTIDQYGEEVELYDFAQKGKYIVIEMSAAWCRPCNLLAEWMTYGEKDLSEFRWWKSEYSKIRDLVLNEEIYFINIQYEDKYKDNASLESLEDWFQTYPENLIPLLADFNREMHTWVKPNGLPCVIVADENMKLTVFTQRGLTVGFDYLVKEFQ